jgi:hypothetical protein
MSGTPGNDDNPFKALDEDYVPSETPKAEPAKAVEPPTSPQAAAAPPPPPAPPAPAPAPQPTAAPPTHEDVELEGELEDDEDVELEHQRAAHAQTPPPPSAPAEPEPEPEPEPESDPDAELAAFASAASAAPARPRPTTPVKKGGSLKATMVPILGTVGLVLLVPGVWSLLYLMTGVDVWQRDNPRAKGIAMLMLVSWPIAIILVASAVVMARQLMRDKAKT